jgi:hypothetical protein
VPHPLHGQDGYLLGFGTPGAIQGIDGTEFLPHAAVVSVPVTLDERPGSQAGRAARAAPRSPPRRRPAPGG